MKLRILVLLLASIALASDCEDHLELMGMRDDQALMNAINGRRHDDTPYLVLADYYDDHGMPDRAAYIRAEVARLRLPRYATPEERAALNRRSTELAVSASANHPTLEHLPLSFERGVPVGITLHYGWGDRVTPAMLAEVLRLYPSIWHLSVIGGAAETLRALLAIPEAARLRGLRVSSVEGCGAIVARSPALRNLDELHLEFNSLAGRADIEALAGAAHLTGLRRLSLPWNGLTWHELQPLLRSRVARDLVALDVSGARLGREGIAGLFSSALDHLEELRLAGCELPTDALDAIAAARPAFVLKRLDLSSNRLHDLSALETEALESLEELDISNNPLRDETVMALVRSRTLANLQRLDFINDNLSDRVVEAIADSPHMARLRRFNFGANAFTERALEAAIRSPHLNEITDSHVPEEIRGRRLRAAWEARLSENRERLRREADAR